MAPTEIPDGGTNRETTTATTTANVTHESALRPGPPVLDLSRTLPFVGCFTRRHSPKRATLYFFGDTWSNTAVNGLCR